MKKVFIGGYYVENLDMEQKGLAFVKILEMTLEECLEHAAIENVNEYDETFNTMSEEEKITCIEKYILFDEIFGGAFYTKEEAKELIVELKENKELY